jgi:hypothetical protein
LAPTQSLEEQRETMVQDFAAQQQIREKQHVSELAAQQQILEKQHVSELAAQQKIHEEQHASELAAQQKIHDAQEVLEAGQQKIHKEKNNFEMQVMRTMVEEMQANYTANIDRAWDDGVRWCMAEYGFEVADPNQGATYAQVSNTMLIICWEVFLYLLRRGLL